MEALFKRLLYLQKHAREEKDEKNTKLLREQQDGLKQIIMQRTETEARKAEADARKAEAEARKAEAEARKAVADVDANKAALHADYLEVDKKLNELGETDESKRKRLFDRKRILEAVLNMNQQSAIGPLV